MMTNSSRAQVLKNLCTDASTATLNCAYVELVSKCRATTELILADYDGYHFEHQHCIISKNQFSLLL